MPLIDVTELLFDPDIANQSFQVIRRKETVDDHGEVSFSTVSYCAVGSVTPTGVNSLVREEAFSSMQNTIRVITTFRLRGPSSDSSGDYGADIVNWDNDDYIVRSINEYTQFGAGFVEAECVQMKQQMLPPE